MSFRNDDELLEDYGKRGDNAAFEELYRRYKTPLFGYIRQQLPDNAANEVFQDTWESVISQASRYMPSGSFRAFIFSICRRRIADFWRAHCRHAPAEASASNGETDAHGSHQFDPQLIQIDKATDQIILKCVGRLPRKQQEAFMLKQTGLAADEISLTIGVAFETVKSRIRAAYQNLRVCWERHHD